MKMLLKVKKSLEIVALTVVKIGRNIFISRKDIRIFKTFVQSFNKEADYFDLYWKCF